MKTPIRKSVPHFRIVSHISRLSANFRVSTFQVLVDPGRSWLALIGLGWSQDTWAWSWNALQHPETPWNTLKHLVQSCPEMWDTMDLNWCPTFQDLVYPMVYLCNNIPSPPGYHTSLFIPRMASSDLWNHKGNLIGHSSIYIAFASVSYLFKSATNSNPTSAILSGTF